MIDRLAFVLEALVMFMLMIFVERYVFFEKPIEAKKQRIYYIVFAVITVISSSLLISDFISIVFLSFLGINIFLGRKKHRIRGIFLGFPIIGIVQGLICPVLGLPTNMIHDDNTTGLAIYQISMLAIIALICLLLIYNKKKIDRWLRIDFEKRELRSWERILLISIGIFLAIVSIYITEPVDLWLSDLEFDNPTNALSMLVFFFSIGVFIITITVLSVIVAGNKQSHYHQQVRDMQFNIIVLMADLVENRDSNTGGHIKRTAKYVEIIARKLKAMGVYEDQLTSSFIDDIIVAAPLHDIGKIHVADAVLNKPGRLTDEEFEIMKTHSAQGRDILAHAKGHLGDFSYLDVAVDMAGAHHEWWDGSKKGYPEGLSGEDIPLSARIMAVADVFDALTSKRCYKEPMPAEKAYSIIEEESGTHFDPKVVEAFFAARAEVDKELERFLTEQDEAIKCSIEGEHIHL